MGAGPSTNTKNTFYLIPEENVPPPNNNELGEFNELNESIYPSVPDFSDPQNDEGDPPPPFEFPNESNSESEVGIFKMDNESNNHNLMVIGQQFPIFGSNIHPNCVSVGNENIVTRADLISLSPTPSTSSPYIKPDDAEKMDELFKDIMG